jgi:hypothetical protein
LAPSFCTAAVVARRPRDADWHLAEGVAVLHGAAALVARATRRQAGEPIV